MPVLINWKICDNAKECNGVAICPSGAITWNEKKKTIKIDNSKCTNCGKCEPSCAVGAIRFAKDKKEYNRIRREIDDDPRKISDLFVDRYGGIPTDVRGYGLKEKDFTGRILEATRKLAVVEVWNGSSIHCLDASIPIKELISEDDVIYRKMEIKKLNFLKKYTITKLPALLFFREGKLIGKIEGFYNKQMKNELREKIKEIIS